MTDPRRNEYRRRWRLKQKPEFISARAESDALEADLCSLMERKALIDRLICLYEAE